MTVQVGRAFWGVVAVATVVVALIAWRVHTADQAQSRRLAKAECQNTLSVLRRQLSGAKTTRGTDRFFATKSESPIFRTHFAGLIPAQTAKIAAIKTTIGTLGACG